MAGEIKEGRRMGKRSESGKAKKEGGRMRLEEGTGKGNSVKIRWS